MCLKKFFANLFKKKDQGSPEILQRDKTILIVEDEEGQRLTFQKILEGRGFKTLLAENGERGLALARAHKPSLILLDVIMPEIDGIEVCRQLKADVSTFQIPIIFLTAADSPDDIIKHFEAGGETHLAKPVDAKELVRQIEITFES